MVVARQQALPPAGGQVRASDEQLAQRARQGSQPALEELVRRFQDRVYGLALRMLYNPPDAEDATQEILIKLVTNLQGYRGEGTLAAWVYRVAANHLISVRRSRGERAEVTLEQVNAQLDRHQASTWRESESVALRAVLVQEARISCLQGLLLSLDRGHRLALILGLIFQFSSEQGAYILDIGPAAFRKRVSRARRRLRDFMAPNCSLMHPDNRCTCEGSIGRRVAAGWLDPKRPLFTCHPQRPAAGAAMAKEYDEMCRMTALFRSVPEFIAPRDFAGKLKEMLHATGGGATLAKGDDDVGVV